MIIEYTNKPLIKEHLRQLMDNETKLPFPLWLKEKNPSEYKRWLNLVKR